MGFIESKKVARVNPDDYRDSILMDYARALNLQVEPKRFSLREKLYRLLGKTSEGLEPNSRFPFGLPR